MKENSKLGVNSSENSKKNSANLANSAKGVNLKANSSKNSKKNSANLANSKPNSSPNSNSGSNFSSNLKAIFALPKGAKVFLVALTALAAVGLVVAFSLKIWAADKIESGEIVLKGIDRGAQTRILRAENVAEQEIKAFLQSLDTKNATPSPEFQAKEGSQSAENSVVPSKFAYQNRLYFQRLDFLLRSKVIAYIDIQGISWASGIDKNAISDISSHNRWVKFATTQDLLSQGFAEKNLGQVSYKMDFSPLIKTIVKYYAGIVLAALLIFALKDLLFKFFSSGLAFGYIAYALVALGVIMRIYQYIFHKDLWLDEAYIAYSMYGVGWGEIFFTPLPLLQSAPLVFLVLSKFLGGIFGYSEHTLYFLPCVFGILTLFLALKIAQLLFGKNSFGFLCFITLVCGSLGLLWYSAEFKQYGIEAFCAFLLVYFYLKNLDFKRFIILSVPCFLSSHTGIFVAFACVFGYFYKSLSSPFSLKAWIRANKSFIALSVGLGVLFLVYYFAYVRFQAVAGFFDAWKEWFIPLDLQKLPSFFIKILPVYSGFTPFGDKNIVPVFMFISLVGLCALWEKRRDFFMVCASAMLVYIGLSACQIYPFGWHSGVSIGGRLSLFMAVFFYVLCASGLVWLYEKFSAKWCKDLCVVVLLGLVILSGYKNVQKFYPQYRYIQQTHEFITQIAKEYTQSKLPESAKCVFVYRWSNPAFMYYSHLDGTKTPKRVFDNDFKIIDVQAYKVVTSDDYIKDFECQKSWILASHYTRDNIDSMLVQYAKDINKNVKVEKSNIGWGSILIRAEK